MCYVCLGEIGLKVFIFRVFACVCLRGFSSLINDLTCLKCIKILITWRADAASADETLHVCFKMEDVGINSVLTDHVSCILQLYLCQLPDSD